jgi:hypothetical protein
MTRFISEFRLPQRKMFALPKLSAALSFPQDTRLKNLIWLPQNNSGHI